MNYTSEAMTLALSELQKRRENALIEQASHVEIIKEYPDIYSAYTAVVSTKDKLAQVIFSKQSNARDRIDEIKDDNLKDQKLLSDALRRHGFVDDYLKPAYKCKKCSDSGYVMGLRCECLESLLARFTIEELNKQCKIKLNSFADFNLSYYSDSLPSKSGIINAKELMKDNLETCMKYANEFTLDSPSLFMLGGTGLGKTFLSSCIAKQVISQGYSVAFDSIQNYLRQIEKEHFSNQPSDTLDTLLSSDLLILDDLGSEFTTSFNSSVIYNIINSRLNLCKPTIISSNIGFNELSKRYDDRIVSRLTGSFLPIRFVGTDIRQIKRQKGIYN